MEETSENNAVQEVVTPEVENHSPQPQADSQEKNWREVRQQLAELKRQNQEKDDLIRSIYESQQKQQQPKEPEIDLDEYANYGGVQKVAKKTVEPIQKEIEELRQELKKSKQKELFNEMRSKYPDYDDVVNPETIALLEEKEPELANSIALIKDPHAMTIQTYKFIKASGILDEVPSKRRQKETQKQIEKNEKTIQSPQAYDKRPMAQAFKMTEQEKSKLWEEMNQYASLASSVPPL